MIAVVGVGAIGGVCSANLAAAGHEVVACVRRPFDTLVLDAPDGRLESAPRVAVDPARAKPAEWVLFATKAHQTAGAAIWLDTLLADGTRVAVLQNGVEHVDRLSQWVDPARLVPVVVACPATARAPGHVEQRRPAKLTVPDDANGRSFAALFAGTAVAVHAAEDWKREAWRKLCSNVTGGAIAALAGVPLADVRHERAGALARALAYECAAVARAEGADVPDEFAAEIARGALGAGPGGMPSTLTDRLAGRPLEWEARNGAVVRIGARHGIATPVNECAARLMAEAHRDASRDWLPELSRALP